ncbi:MAG: response regulator [Theionarchaea archaeon]|nr:response regulator [Theionarchaea archaeon]
MAYRKTLSLSRGDMQKLAPILEKHNGNFSAAVRELIALGDVLMTRFGTIEEAIHELYPKKSLPQELVENRYGILLPYSLVQWGLRLLDGFLPPKSTLVTPVHDALAQSRGLSLAITPETCDQWQRLLNELYPQLGWEVKITMKPSNSNLVVSFSGLDPEINRLAQMVLAVRLAFQDPPYAVTKLEEYLPLVTISFEKCSSQKEAAMKLEDVFHVQKELYELFQKRRTLLSRLAVLVQEFNYDVAVFPAEYMDDLLNEQFSLFFLKLIQRHRGKSVSELSTEEFLQALDEINGIAHLYEKMELEDNRIVFFHSYDDPGSTRKLGGILTEILQQANLALSLEVAENMLVFKTSPTKKEKPKLLIGDEKLESLLSLRYELEPDFEILDAQDGYEVMKKARQNPSVIILNLTLPKMNGIEVCSVLKSDVTTRSIPIVLLVPEESSEEIQALPPGVEEYIIKPFQVTDLRTVIESVLSRKGQ